MMTSFSTRVIVLLLSFALAGFSSGAVRSKSRSKAKTTKVKTAKVKAGAGRSRYVKTAKASGRARLAKARFVKTRLGKKSRYKRYRLRNANFVAGGPWFEPTFADSTVGDDIDGEDLMVRRAAVEALGPYNGSVVVADAQSGRLLTVVNQRIAFQSGFQPCSTIKIVAAVAGLNEGVIDRSTNMRLYGRTHMNLTDALAKSNNPFFANIGVKLGYDKIAYYSRLLGLGEKAGLNIAAERAGSIPEAPPKNGGMGMMMSFGEGIKLTPLQLTALLSSIANGGTMYYLQHPTSQLEAEAFSAKVKRQLAIRDAFPDVRPGLQGAVEYGTARRAGFDPNEPIFGKTGTCTDRATPTHLGWFGSFNEVAGRNLVVVVLLTGGRPVNGPVAAGIAGAVYRNLSQQHFYAALR